MPKDFIRNGRRVLTPQEIQEQFACKGCRAKAGEPCKGKEPWHFHPSRGRRTASDPDWGAWQVECRECHAAPHQECLDNDDDPVVYHDKRKEDGKAWAIERRQQMQRNYEENMAKREAWENSPEGKAHQRFLAESREYNDEFRDWQDRYDRYYEAERLSKTLSPIIRRYIERFGIPQGWENEIEEAREHVREVQVGPEPTEPTMPLFPEDTELVSF